MSVIKLIPRPSVKLVPISIHWDGKQIQETFALQSEHGTAVFDTQRLNGLLAKYKVPRGASIKIG